MRASCSAAVPRPGLALLSAAHTVWMSARRSTRWERMVTVRPDGRVCSRSSGLVLGSVMGLLSGLELRIHLSVLPIKIEPWENEDQSRSIQRFVSGEELTKRALCL